MSDTETTIPLTLMELAAVHGERAGHYYTFDDAYRFEEGEEPAWVGPYSTRDEAQAAAVKALEEAFAATTLEQLFGEQT